MNLFFRLGIFLNLLAFTACAAWPKGTRPFATAKLEPRSGSKASGTAELARKGDDLVVRFHLENVSPGAHGVHFHEKGDCSAPDASSAGAHYNPLGHPHGGPGSEKRHVGDLGNIEIPRSGTLSTTVTVGLPPGFDEKQLIDKSIVLHADPDDLKSQPSGNSGARIACGVVRAASPVSE